MARPQECSACTGDYENPDATAGHLDDATGVADERDAAGAVGDDPPDWIEPVR